jgi:glycosyltransferase involved in cell wall biosynthesis
MTKKRVLVVYPHLPHYRYGVFKELETSPDFEFTFCGDLTSRDGSIKVIPPEMLRSTLRVRNYWLGPFLIQRGLLRHVFGGAPDVVIFLGDVAYLSTWVSALLARARGATVLYWTIGWHRPETGLRRAVRIAFYRLAHSIMLYGPTGFHLGKTLGYPTNRMFIVGNSERSSSRDSEPTDEQIQRFKRALPDKTAVVGAVIRFTPVKRLDLILEAVARLRSRGTDVSVLLVGDGPERDALKRRAAELGVPLFLTGPAYSRQELELAYAELDVCVIPSTAGLTVLQSLSYGCPVITHDDPITQAPEADAVIDGVNGARYRAGSIEDLSEHLEGWLRRVHEDPERWSRACKDSLERGWTPQSQAERIFVSVAASEGLHG